MRQLAALEKIRTIVPWLPAYVWQRCVRRLPDIRPLHLIVGLADHFEPMNRTGASGQSVDCREQERRLKKWCSAYPAAVDAWRDDEGQPFRHTYFYPAEEYEGALIERLVEHCQ